MIGQRISFDTSIEGMFAEDNPQLIQYQRLKEIFGGAEIALAVYEDPDLFTIDGSGLARLEQNSQRIADVRGVHGVLSLAEINGALKQVYTLVNLLKGEDIVEPILQTDNPLAQQFREMFEGYTHGRDGRTVAIVCLLDPMESLHVPRESTIAELRRVVLQWPQGKVTGEPVLVADGFRFVQRDGRRLNRVSLLLMGIVIIGCFRSIRWMLIPIIVIQLALWMTMALLVLFGWHLTMVSSMLSAIVAVISVATIVHFTVRFRESRLRQGRSRIESVEFALASLLVPITWTCITTAAGFLALTIAAVEPVSDFGWMMAIGSMMVLASMLLVVPGLALLGNLDSDPQITWGDGRLTQLLKYSSQVVTRYPRRIGFVLLLLFAVVGFGTRFIKVETDFTKNFRSDSEIARAYSFVERRLGGAGIMDVVIPSPDSLDEQFMTKVDRLQDELRKITLSGSGGLNPPDLTLQKGGDPELGKDSELEKRGDRELETGGVPALTHVVSFADANRAISSHPLLRFIPPQVRFDAMSVVMPGFSNQMKTREADANGQHYFRIMLRTSQQKSANEQTELISRVQQIVDRHFPRQAQTEAFTSGFFVLLSNLVSSVLQDQTRTFVVATIFIAVAMLLAFASPKLMIIALLPNIMPIVGLLGMLGWLGIPINMGSAMIAAVSIGLSIDGTIHYLNSYRHNRKAGHRTASSIERVQQRIGRAVTYATMALVAGFGSLCISEFIPTVYFGALVGLSMLGGMLGNLIVLPILLTIFDSDRKFRQPQVHSTTPTKTNSKIKKPHDSPVPGPHCVDIVDQSKTTS